MGVGSFEYGRLHDNILSANVVTADGELCEISGKDVASLMRGSILVRARLRTRRADEDVPFAAAFGDAMDLASALETLVSTKPPLWHLAFLNSTLAHARRLRDHYLLFGAYPRGRTNLVEGPLREAVAGHRGKILEAPDAYKVWGERFFPVTPSAASVPEIVKESLPLTEVWDALTRLEGRGVSAVQGSISRDGETLVLAFA
jgi:FAD/FMN-containing dehydrogenase